MCFSELVEVFLVVVCAACERRGSTQEPCGPEGRGRRRGRGEGEGKGKPEGKREKEEKLKLNLLKRPTPRKLELLSWVRDEMFELLHEVKVQTPKNTLINHQLINHQLIDDID